MATTIRGRTNRRLFILPCSNFELLGAGGCEAAHWLGVKVMPRPRILMFLYRYQDSSIQTHTHIAPYIYFKSFIGVITPPAFFDCQGDHPALKASIPNPFKV